MIGVQPVSPQVVGGAIPKPCKASGTAQFLECTSAVEGSAPSEWKVQPLGPADKHGQWQGCGLQSEHQALPDATFQGALRAEGGEQLAPSLVVEGHWRGQGLVTEKAAFLAFYYEPVTGAAWQTRSAVGVGAENRPCDLLRAEEVALLSPQLRLSASPSQVGGIPWLHLQAGDKMELADLNQGPRVPRGQLSTGVSRKA